MAPWTTTTATLASLALTAHNALTGSLPPYPRQVYSVPQPLHQHHLRRALLQIASDPARHGWQYVAKDREEFSDARSSRHRGMGGWFDVVGDGDGDGDGVVRMGGKEGMGGEEEVELKRVDQLHLCRERGWVTLGVGERLEVEEEEDEEEVQGGAEVLEEEEAYQVGTLPQPSTQSQPACKTPVDAATHAAFATPPETPAHAATDAFITPPQSPLQPRSLPPSPSTTTQPKQHRDRAYPTIELSENFFVQQPRHQEILSAVLEKVTAGTSQSTSSDDDSDGDSDEDKEQDAYSYLNRPGGSERSDVPGKRKGKQAAGVAWPQEWRLDGKGWVQQSQSQSQPQLASEPESQVQKAKIWDAETDEEEAPDEEEASEAKEDAPENVTKPPADSKFQKKDSVISDTYSSVLTAAEYKLVAPLKLPAHCVPTTLRTRREAFDVPKVDSEDGEDAKDADDGVEKGLAASGFDIAAASDIEAVATKLPLLQLEDSKTLLKQKAKEERKLHRAHKQARKKAAAAAPKLEEPAALLDKRQGLGNLVNGGMVNERSASTTAAAEHAVAECPTTPPPETREVCTSTTQAWAPARPRLTRGQSLRPATPPPPPTPASRGRQRLRNPTNTKTSPASKDNDTSNPRASSPFPGLVYPHSRTYYTADDKHRSLPKVHFLEPDVDVEEGCVRYEVIELQNSKDDFRRLVMACEPSAADCKRGRKMVKRMGSRRWRLWRRITRKSEE